MDAIILLGGPGAGKGTVSEVICGQAGFTHVSTGDMLRAAIREGTPVGLKAKSYIDAGELVPDQVILDLIDCLVSQADSEQCFLFDGFPRTISQADGLAGILDARQAGLSHVLRLDVGRDILIQRLTGRRICKTCGAVYHLINRPPKKEGICDVDGGELYQRSDDCLEAIENRLDVYERQTAPLVSYYQERGLLRTIDASVAIDQVVAQVVDVLNG